MASNPLSVPSSLSWLSLWESDFVAALEQLDWTENTILGILPLSLHNLFPAMLRNVVIFGIKSTRLSKMQKNNVKKNPA